MSVMSEEREGSSAGRPMSTAEVPSSDEKKRTFLIARRWRATGRSGGGKHGTVSDQHRVR